ncbi:MAG: hypothetical protein AB1847_02580 [bacterium]
MKRKMLVIVPLSLFFLFLLMARVHAGLLSSRFQRNNSQNNTTSQDNTSQDSNSLNSNSLDNNSQRGNWLFWRNQASSTDQGSLVNLKQWINLPLADNEESLQWIRDQINTVLNQLQEVGLDIPSNLDQNLNKYFSLVRTYLGKNERHISLPLPNRLLNPNYNMKWNYDQETDMMDFVADRVLSNERSLTSIDLSGSFGLNNGPWKLTFAVVNAVSDRERGGQRRPFLQGALSRIGSSTASQDTTKDPAQSDDDTSMPGVLSSNFILSGELCQDGLTSLYLNPSQIMNLNFMNKTYATQTGIEIFQDAGSRAGKFYMDIMDKSVSGANDKLIYHWEWPLWQGTETIDR